MAGGYGGATVRAIATDAGVDVAMVYYFFGGKQGLFSEALVDDHPLADLPALLDGDRSDVGRRLVRTCLERWDAGEMEPFLALWTSAIGDDEAKQSLVDTVLRPLVGGVVDQLEVPDAALRVELVASHLAGLAIARYRLRLEPIAAESRDVLVDWVGPTVQRYLTAASPG